MNFSRSENLGIIACPGGERFATEMIPYMRKQYLKKYDRLADSLSRKYGEPRQDVIRRINFASDINAVEPCAGKALESFVPPNFKIPVRFTRFANGEFKSEILTSVRGMDVFIVQDVENHVPLKFYNLDTAYSLSVSDHLMCIFVTVDAALQAGAKNITLVLPTYPYARQHERKGREALSAAWFGRTCEFSGVSRIITLDIHSRAIANCFSKTSLENLHASYQILLRLKNHADVRDPNLVVVSPDTGAVDRNKFYAGNLKKSLALLYKERDYSMVTKDANNSNIRNFKLLGNVEGKTIFMADDMLGTGGTLIKAMKVLREMGAKKIICAVSLPFFTGTAIDDFEKAYQDGLFDVIIGTNSVYHGDELLKRRWYDCADVTDLFARTIVRLHQGHSLSPLLDNARIIQKLLNEA